MHAPPYATRLCGLGYKHHTAHGASQYTVVLINSYSLVAIQGYLLFWRSMKVEGSIFARGSGVTTGVLF